jgi:hypothetical protein
MASVLELTFVLRAVEMAFRFCDETVVDSLASLLVNPLGLSRPYRPTPAGSIVDLPQFVSKKIKSSIPPADKGLFGVLLERERSR